MWVDKAGDVIKLLISNCIATTSALQFTQVIMKQLNTWHR